MSLTILDGLKRVTRERIAPLPDDGLRRRVSAKDSCHLLTYGNPPHPLPPFGGTLRSQSVPRIWRRRAGEENRAFLQVFGNPFHLACLLIPVLTGLEDEFRLAADTGFDPLPLGAAFVGITQAKPILIQLMAASFFQCHAHDAFVDKHHPHATFSPNEQRFIANRRCHRG